MRLRKCPEGSYSYGYNIKKKLNAAWWKFLFALALVAVVFLLGARFGRLKDGKALVQQSVVVGDKASAVVSIEEIEGEIRNIGELSTVEYFYTDAGKFTDAHHIRDLKIPLTTKSFIVRWDGTIKAGIVLSKVNVDVNENKKTIMIHIPKAEILSHEVDEKSLEILDETKNIFNPISVDDMKTFMGDSKDFMEDKAVKNGLLDKAVDNAQTVIKNQLNLNSVINDNYSVDFEVAEE